MKKGKDEDLDSVIADLIDGDTDTGAEPEPGGDAPSPGSPPDGQSPFEGIDRAKTTTGGPAVSLTSRAAQQVRKIREDESLDDDLYLRVAVEGGGCSGLSYKLGFDYKSEEDESFESEGIDIVVDPRHLMYLEGISIDFPDGLDARGFTFNNPNAEETCGCGTSFAT